MLAVVIVLGVLIVIALILLVVGMMTKMGKHNPAPVTDTGMFALPANSQILDMQSQPNRLILRIRTPQGDEVDIIDPEDGHIVSRIRAPK